MNEYITDKNENGLLFWNANHEMKSTEICIFLHFVERERERNGRRCRNVERDAKNMGESGV